LRAFVVDGALMGIASSLKVIDDLVLLLMSTTLSTLSTTALDEIDSSPPTLIEERVLRLFKELISIYRNFFFFII
jgi:hypothetical protein